MTAPLSLVPEPRSTVLTDDAQFIRDQFAGIERGMLAIADRLREVRDREGWTVRQLAKWCDDEHLPFWSKSRVDQLLKWSSTVEALSAVGVLSTTVDTPPSEWTLRPLAKAIGQGMAPEEAGKVWTDVIDNLPASRCYGFTNHSGDQPTLWDVAEVVDARQGHAQILVATDEPGVLVPIAREADEVADGEEVQSPARSWDEICALVNAGLRRRKHLPEDVLRKTVWGVVSDVEDLCDPADFEAEVFAVDPRDRVALVGALQRAQLTLSRFISAIEASG